MENYDYVLDNCYMIASRIILAPLHVVALGVDVVTGMGMSGVYDPSTL